MDDSFGVNVWLEKAITVLAQEGSGCRPQNPQGQPGGLVLLNEEIPTWVIPDLHGRHGFLSDFMSSSVGGRSLVEQLEKGLAQVVCLGDGLHTEIGTGLRWNQALQEYRDRFQKNQHMGAEMKDGLQTMALVMEYKVRFGPYFHFLKGNHENILDQSGGPNRSVVKFALESKMVRAWVERFLGRDFLRRYAEFEAALPLLAQGRCFLCAHSRPLGLYTVEQVVNRQPETVFGLTWTRDKQADPTGVLHLLKEFLRGDFETSLMVVGHAPVIGLYDWEPEQKLLKIHNPDKQVVCQFAPDRPFDLSKDVFEFGG